MPKRLIGSPDKAIRETLDDKKQLIRIGVDLLWVRPGQIGGTESYIRNLLEGLMQHAPNEMHFVLFVSEDNYGSFEKYRESKKFELVRCNIKSTNIVKRILWENMFLDEKAQKWNIDLMFIPVYSMPRKKSSIPYVVTIHDLQALHFPEYFSNLKNFWLRWSWKRSVKRADRIIAISNFVKQDIHKRLNINTEKIKVIYNPITQAKEFEAFQRVSEQFGVEKYKYFYTISSLSPHKNTEVLIRLIARLKDKKTEQIPIKLLISGIKGSQASYLKNLANDLDVLDEIIFTGFVSNAVRNTLYKYAYAFLFPSTFEGFGMPPVEALMLGTPVITTKCASIPEVTKNKCKYVDEPTKIEEWEKKVLEIDENEREAQKFPEYELKFVTSQITKLFFLTVANTAVQNKLKQKT